MSHVSNNDPVPYITNDDDRIISQAIQILESRLRTTDVSDKGLTNPDAAIQLLHLLLAPMLDENVAVMFLTSQHHMIRTEVLFKGSIDSCSVHPRVIVRRALDLNAAAIVLAHNHPSGLPQPSEADKVITTRISTACSYFDIRVLDHIIITNNVESAYSFAKNGLM